MNEIERKNREKFEAFRKFQLPLDQYAIISSGPLGIRNLREIGDIDLIVLPELWDILAAKFGIVIKNGIKKIEFPGKLIEAFMEGSFPETWEGFTIKDRIEKAEIIDGLSFESLENVLYFKRKMGRDKDLKDIQLIESWLKQSR